MNDREWYNIRRRLEARFGGDFQGRVEEFQFRLSDLDATSVNAWIERHDSREPLPNPERLRVDAAGPRPAGLPPMMPWPSPVLVDDNPWARHRALVVELWPDREVGAGWGDACRDETKLDPVVVSEVIRQLADSGYDGPPPSGLVLRLALLAGAGGRYRQREARQGTTLSGSAADVVELGPFAGPEQGGRRRSTDAAALMAGLPEHASPEVRSVERPLPPKRKLPWWLAVIAEGLFGGPV